MREVDNRIAAIDLNGNHIIRDCKTILVFLKKKLIEMKEFVQSEPFENDAKKSPFSNSTNRGLWLHCFISTISCVLRANVRWVKRNWTLLRKTTRGTEDVLRPPCGIFPILP